MSEKQLINRNIFNLDHCVRQTCKFGQLLPFLIQEIIPGDTMKININSLVRFQPMLSPAMSDIYGKMELFFVPYRLLWKNWENFITGGLKGNDTSVMPYFRYSTGTTSKSLFDYMGIGNGYKGKISALHVRAINEIWNTWYMDENLQTERFNSYEDGLDTTTDTSIPFRNYEKDYYTCAFPYAQKGPQVYLPLGTSAPVITTNNTVNDSGVSLKWSHSANSGNCFLGLYAGHGGPATTGLSGDNSASALYVDNLRPINLETDLTTATAATVEDIRRAFQIQKFQFLNLKGGSRYVEYLYNYYGVRSSDARVQRPELIASNTFNVLISEVLQTSDNISQNTPTGTMYGHAIASGSSGIVEKSFEEFGVLIGLYSIQPKTEYMQMVEKSYTRFDKFDYYNPVFAFLGYQAITNKEIYSASTDPDGTFGFQGRYDELRHRQSYVCGDLKTNLKFWTLSREFDKQPVLNSDFINASNSTDRIFADTTDDYIIVEFYNDIEAYRGLPKTSDPGLIDHIYQ